MHQLRGGGSRYKRNSLKSRHFELKIPISKLLGSIKISLKRFVRNINDIQKYHRKRVFLLDYEERLARVVALVPLACWRLPPSLLSGRCAYDNCRGAGYGSPGGTRQSYI